MIIYTFPLKVVAAKSFASGSASDDRMLIVICHASAYNKCKPMSITADLAQRYRNPRTEPTDF